MFDVIGFDADDTLWHTEVLYTNVQARFRQLLAPYGDPDQVDRQLYLTETGTLTYYGYGIKSFALSLIETTAQLSRDCIPVQLVTEIISLAKTMLTAEVLVMEHAQGALARLAAAYPLMLITKGELSEQEPKIARSGLSPHFRYLEIMADKTPDRYAALLERHRLQPARFLMVGNSLRSDILPVLELGGYAVHIPYHLTWEHEVAELPGGDHCRYFKLEHLGQLPALIEQLDQGDQPPLFLRY
jgi:putative hydrolase of the HAD superfamily